MWGVSLPSSSRAPRVSLALKTPFPFPFKRLPRRLVIQLQFLQFRLFSHFPTTTPLALAVNKSPAVYILSPALDGLSRENRGSVNRL